MTYKLKKEYIETLKELEGIANLLSKKLNTMQKYSTESKYEKPSICSIKRLRIELNKGLLKFEKDSSSYPNKVDILTNRK